MTGTAHSPPRPGPPTRLPSPRITRDLRRFLATEVGGGLLLIAATAAALVWANSPWSGAYDRLWATEAGIRVGGAELVLDLRHWVDDGLMALFFLVVGLEVTREVTVGELRDRRRIVVPVAAALGGMVLPAAIYLAFNAGGDGAAGWGIAMATDIAFVLGALALVPRAPDSLRLFLLTVAIVDDIGAILVIAVFYSDDVDVLALGAVAILVAALVALRWLRAWRPPAYVAVGLALWFAVLQSGVHATIAGVLVGLLVSTRAPAPAQEVDPYARALAEEPATAEQARLTRIAAGATVSPNERLQHALHPWTAYLIVPLFAFANAGVRLDAETLRAAATSPVTIGIVAALVLGKSIGIAGTTLLASRGRPGFTRGELAGGATLAGIGFTVALFIAELAFDDEALKDQAVVGVLAGSLLAAALGASIFRVLR